jgi:hypothetical protein
MPTVPPGKVPGMSLGTLLNTFVQSPGKSARVLLRSAKRGLHPREAIRVFVDGGDAVTRLT